MAGGPRGGDSDAFDQNAVAIGTNSSITKEKATTRERPSPEPQRG